jgi:hypothetical protein
VVIVEHRTLRRPIIDVFSRDRNIELIAQDASIESRDDRSGARADDSTAQEESEGDIVQDLCDAADATNLQDVRFIRPEVLGVALDESVRPVEPLHVSDPAVSYGSLPSTSITVPTHFTYGTRLGISVWAVKQLDLREPQRRHARRRASIETVILVRWVRRMRQKAERLRRFPTGSREITLAGYGRSDASLHSTLWNGVIEILTVLRPLVTVAFELLAVLWPLGSGIAFMSRFLVEDSSSLLSCVYVIVSHCLAVKRRLTGVVDVGLIRNDGLDNAVAHQMIGSLHCLGLSLHQLRCKLVVKRLDDKSRATRYNWVCSGGFEPQGEHGASSERNQGGHMVSVWRRVARYWMRGRRRTLPWAGNARCDARVQLVRVAAWLPWGRTVGLWRHPELR